MLLSAIPSPPSQIAGSPLWQTVFISFAVILILLEVIRGWRLGILRQLVRVAAIIAAYATAFFCGDRVVPLLRPLVTMPDIVLSAVAGAILAILVYASIAGLGSVLFKRTAQQSSGAVRLLYGLSGAFVGLLFGAFFIWLLLIGIRSVGSIAEAQVQAKPARDSIRAASNPASDDRAPASPALDADSLTLLLARLKNSVELGTTGGFIKKADAMPDGVYRTLTDASVVLANPETAQRLLSYPAAAELSEHPKIVALRDDPELTAIIREGRLLELLSHPKVVEAANDPDLAERVKRFDLKKALEYAAKKN
ncbi:MAG TPA: CvpA family protein [Chthoniobacterales bacterium]|nr:CvpA family protein [Chthoniobacterales bacterium]